MRPLTAESYVMSLKTKILSSLNFYYYFSGVFQNLFRLYIKSLLGVLFFSLFKLVVLCYFSISPPLSDFLDKEHQDGFYLKGNEAKQFRLKRDYIAHNKVNTI